MVWTWAGMEIVGRHGGQRWRQAALAALLLAATLQAQPAAALVRQSVPAATQLAPLANACAMTATATASAIAPTAATCVAPARLRHGALYRITRAGQTSYLFGTLHVGAVNDASLAPEVRQAMAHSHLLVVELDTRAQAPYQLALRRHARYRAGDSIAHHITPATLAALTDALHGFGIPVHEMACYKPWLLANMLTGMALARGGLARSAGAEFSLLASAQQQGKPVAELESADQQLALFDTLDDAAGERYLRETLHDLASGRALQKARAMIAAWTAADAAGLDAQLPAFAAGDSVVSDFTRRTLLDKRNPEMASRLEHLIDSGQLAFVGVGLLHLLGKQGLPRLLQQRGYQVERVY
jgi:uncharacterized protein YbaP (TraB family)